MLSGFRSFAKGFVSKILLSFLVITFGIWGIHDIFRGNFSGNAVATVGDVKIQPQQLDQMMERLQRAYPQLGADAAHNPQLRLEALRSLINNALLHQESGRLRLNYSRAALAEYIRRNPNFQKADGSFDGALFKATLQANGFTESDYLARLQEDLSAALLRDTVATGLIAPDDMIQLLHAARNETREADIILVTAADVPAPAEPSDDELKKLYDENPQAFIIPESRTLRYVSFTPDDLWKALKIDAPEDTAREQKIIELTNQLEDALAGGATMDEALKQVGLSSLPIQTLSSVTLAEDPFTDVRHSILETGFKLEKGRTSSLALQDGTYYLVQAMDVTPQSVQPMEAVLPKLKKLHAERAARDAARAKADSLAETLKKAADARAAAKDAGLKLTPSGPLKREEDTVSNDSKLKDKILTAGFVREIFRLKPQQASGAYPLPSGEYAIGILTDIHPAPKLDAKTEAALREELSMQLSGDVMDLYSETLRQDYGVQIEPSALGLKNSNE